MSEKFEGLTGRLFESEVLPKLSDEWRQEGYFNEQRSFEWVRNHQQWNPSDPSNKIANELHFLVAQKLNVDDVNELKLYSAINSPLDYHYGIDAFFEIGDSIFTLDLSVNLHKEVAKADMVIQEKDLSDIKSLEKTAEIISNYLGKSRVTRLKKAA